MNEDLRFPLGEFDKNIQITPALRDGFIKTILNLHDDLARAVSGLGENGLDTPYRPGGWTIKQTIHHIADSHINSFVRFKLALTEEVPTIRPYSERFRKRNCLSTIRQESPFLKCAPKFAAWRPNKSSSI